MLKQLIKDTISRLGPNVTSGCLSYEDYLTAANHVLADQVHNLNLNTKLVVGALLDEMLEMQCEERVMPGAWSFIHTPIADFIANAAKKQVQEQGPLYIQAQTPEPAPEAAPVPA